jgi:formylglycine-generating enzyme required for sulfatase activity
MILLTKLPRLFLGTLLFFIVLCGATFAQPGMSLVPFKDKSGEQVGLYSGSYALVIGVSDYQEYPNAHFNWHDLPGVKTDIQLVRTALEEQGFHVIVVEDPDHEELEKAFKSFIQRYGHELDNRLLFYFSGHGHTLKLGTGVEMGYIVPADAPTAAWDKKGFLNKAMDMQQIEVYAKRIQAKHALFLFDSCFSGSIFSLTRATPAYINYKTNQPVRQFITAGRADEEVPDESIFRAQFISALEGEADADGDGYLTGNEVGAFIEKKVINYSRESQHPQFGTIRDPNLDKGDFIFQLTTTGREHNTKIFPAPPLTVLQGHLQINVNVPASKVYVSGEFKGYAHPDRPLNLANLSMGEVSVRIESQDFKTLEKTVFIKKNTWTQESFELKKNIPPPPPTSELPAEMLKKMSLIPQGEYIAGYEFGGNDEKPRHEVFLDSFYIDKYEVTQSEYERVMGNNPSAFKALNHPVQSVTWFEANEYCGKVGKRLPSEVEWEIAAQGGIHSSNGIYPWGASFDGKKANFCDRNCEHEWRKNEYNDGFSKTAPVGSYVENGYGLYDMAGNVWEWVADWYDPNFYKKAERYHPRGPVRGKNRVLRGGSWSDRPDYMRVAKRGAHFPSRRYGDYGFRCAKSNE